MKRLLYLDTHQLTAYAWQGGGVHEEDRFSGDPEGFARFSRYLAAHVDSRFLFLCNLPDEGFQIETIPFLQGKDRQSLVERRLAQAFFGTSLTLAHSLGYEQDRRKNERLLLAALTNPSLIQPWLQALTVAEVPLAGLYAFSQLGEQLLKKLSTPPERCLLVTRQKESLRESYLVEGVPVFSRMIPLADPGLEGSLACLSTEVPRLHQYLLSQRQIGRNDTLPVFVLAHPATLPAVRAACHDTAAFNWQFLDTAQAANRLGIRSLLQDSCAEPVFLHLLATSPPPQQYLPPDYRRNHRLFRLKAWLLGSGLAILAVAAVFTATRWVSAITYQQEANDFERDAARLEQRYQQIAATFPQIGVDNTRLRQLARHYQEIERLSRRPDAAYRLLAQSLEASPAIELDAIEWKADGQSDVQAQEQKAQEGAQVAEILVLRGHVTPAGKASARQVLGAFDAWINRLQTHPALHVAVLQQPIDLESGRPIKSDSADETSQPYRFSLQLVYQSGWQ